MELPFLNERNWVLFCLTLAYISAQWSRHSLSYLAGVGDTKCTEICANEIVPLCATRPGSSAACDFCYANVSRAAHYNLKQATCLSEEEYSVLVSYAFHALFAICGLIAGRVADSTTMNRRNIVFYACLGWTGATMLQSFAENFHVLLASRLLMGAFTSFAAPASYSALHDAFPSENLGFANGVYNVGIYLGAGMASLSIALAHLFGWRTASNIASGFGFCCAAGLALFISEPQRKPTRAPAFVGDVVATARQPSQFVLLRKALCDPVLVFIWIGSTLRFLGTFSLAGYLPQFYKHAFPQYNAEFGVLNALVLALAGGTSSALGGLLVDRLEFAFGKRTALVIPISGALLGLAAVLACFKQRESFYLSIALLAASYLLVECWLAPCVKVLEGRVPKQSTATVLSVYLFGGGLLGNVGPILIGQVLGSSGSDQENELGHILSVLMVVSYFGSAVMFALASLWLVREAEFASKLHLSPLLLLESEEPLLLEDEIDM